MGASSSVPVRGTQSFVRTLAACWRRPSLTALEVLWRWVYGVPALATVGYEAMRVLRETPVDVGALQRMSLFDPMGSVATLAEAGAAVLPPVLRVAEWLGPVLLVAWVVASAVGRTVVLRRVGKLFGVRLHERVRALMVLQAVRVMALAVSFAVWFGCVRWAARVAVNGPIAEGQEPSLVLFSAMTIVATLGMFTLWAVVSWGLSVAPLLAMAGGMGAWGLFGGGVWGGAAAGEAGGDQPGDGDCEDCIDCFGDGFIGVSAAV